MEIKTEEPTDNPQKAEPTDSPTHEAMRQASVVEDAPVEDEVTVEKEPVLTIEGQTINPTELVESLVELKDRAKAAGLRPIQNMVTSYISQGLSMVDGLLESLEGKKKKGE